MRIGARDSDDRRSDRSFIWLKSPRAGTLAYKLPWNVKYEVVDRENVPASVLDNVRDVVARLGDVFSRLSRDVQ
jgi:hypothetical protein